MTDVPPPDGWLEEDWNGLPERDEADVYEALRNRRRRLAVLALARSNSGMRLGTLAEIVACVEEGETLRTLSSSARKSRYVTLYQSHADKLEESGLVDVDECRDTFSVTERGRAEAELVAERAAHEDPGMLDALDDVLENAGLTRWDAEVPTRVDMFRVPTGEQFRSLREDAGLTQVEIASAIGCHPASLSQFERNGAGVGVDVLRAAVEYVRRNR